MNIKKLNWIDTTTDREKQNGLLEIIAEVRALGLYYHIRNYTNFDSNLICRFKIGHDNENKTDKFYLFCNNMKEENIEFDNLEDAKKKAQEHFEQRLLKEFYDLEY